MTYHTADHLRMQGMDFVVGMEANHHTCKGVEGMCSDICDELAGKYPKGFKLTGWHPHCRCHVTTVLKTDKEMASDEERMTQGQEPQGGSENEVADVPENFVKWLADKEGRIAEARALPHFLRDNRSLSQDGEYTLKNLQNLVPLRLCRKPLLFHARKRLNLKEKLSSWKN